MAMEESPKSVALLERIETPLFKEISPNSEEVIREVSGRHGWLTRRRTEVLLNRSLELPEGLWQEIAAAAAESGVGVGEGSYIKIAILGWGSLLWEGGQEFDRWHEQWRLGGPSMKLEFSRKSQSRSGELTLVVGSNHGAATTVAWCLSRRRNPDDATCDLRCREGTSLDKIGWVSPRTGYGRSRDLGTREKVIAWAKTQNVDVVVWTDLESNFENFSIPAAVHYLGGLSAEGKARAWEYILRAPDFVRTPLRLALEEEPGLSDSTR
jgi:hypothetical protein